MSLRSKKGFTLFELLIAISIAALLMGVVITQMDRYLELDMKKASNRLASTIRYLYNKSVTEGVYLRIVFDLNEQTYWVEATHDPLLLSTEDINKGKKRKDEEAKKQKGEKAKANAQNEEEANPPPEAEAKQGAAEQGQLPKLELKEPAFSPAESYLLKPTRLPDPIFFKDVMSEHQPIPVEAGQSTINFFPNGYVEHAIINLRDEKDETHYSIETNPITGQVKIENEYKAFEKK